MSIYDMLLANAMGESGGGGGGGGGSSDFSTAEVTVVAINGSVELYNSYNETEQYYTSMYLCDDGTLRNGINADPENSVTASLMWSSEIGDSVTLFEAYGERVSETGSVSYDAETNRYTVWGDCTITMRCVD